MEPAKAKDDVTWPTAALLLGVAALICVTVVAVTWILAR